MAALAGCTGGDGGSGDGGDGGSGDGGDGGSGDGGDGGSGDGGDMEIQEGGTIVWGHSEVVQKLDPHITTTASSARILNNLFNSLMGLTSELEITTKTDVIQPGLAKDFSVSEDLRTYEFTLRDGVKFHDGSTLTSEDVKYSFNRIVEVDGTWSSTFQATNSIETPDDKTVVVNNDYAYQPFLRQLAHLNVAILPQGIGDQMKTNPVGTGPFQFESRQQGTKTVLKAFDDFWGVGPYVDGMEERTFTDPEARFSGVKTGDLDIINDIPLDQINSTVQNDSDNLRTHTWTPLSWIALNFNNVEPPFDDMKFRKAIDFAVDKEELVEGALFGNGRTTASPSFPNSPFRNEELSPREQDFDRARSLIEESQYSADEFTIPLNVTTNFPFQADAGTIMQQQLSEIGVEMEVKKQSLGNWLDALFVNQNFQMGLASFFTFWEPSFMYRNYWGTDGAFNYRGYESERYMETLEEAERAPDRETAIEKYKECQRIIYEDVPDVMVWFRDGTVASKNSFHGIENLVQPNNSNLYFGKAWLEQ
jgi:peptide/nickel transport system substrate-binding protein